VSRIRLQAEGDRLLVQVIDQPDAPTHVFRRVGREQGAAPGGVTIFTPPSGPSQIIPPPPVAESRVIVNGKRLGAAELARIEQTYRVKIEAAEYWYDRKTGAWGLRGGPTRGFVAPALELGGGMLAPDASGGGTQVFVSGRELHPVDVAALQRCLPVLPGRYWVGANGIGGYEGGPPLFNLPALCSQRPGGGSGGLDCDGASCGSAATRTGVSNVTSEGGGRAGVTVNGRLLLTPN
jgi:hypothetical protein